MEQKYPFVSSRRDADMGKSKSWPSCRIAMLAKLMQSTKTVPKLWIRCLQTSQEVKPKIWRIGKEAFLCCTSPRSCCPPVWPSELSAAVSSSSTQSWMTLTSGSAEPRWFLFSALSGFARCGRKAVACCLRARQSCLTLVFSPSG